MPGSLIELSYDGPAPITTAITNRYRHNSRVRSNANPVSNPGATPQFALPTRRFPDRKRVVDKHLRHAKLKQSSPMLTSSQMKAWTEFLHVTYITPR